MTPIEMTEEQRATVECQIDEVDEMIEVNDYQFEFFYRISGYYERNEVLTDFQISALNRIWKRVCGGYDA